MAEKVSQLDSIQTTALWSKFQLSVLRHFCKKKKIEFWEPMWNFLLLQIEEWVLISVSAMWVETKILLLKRWKFQLCIVALQKWRLERKLLHKLILELLDQNTTIIFWGKKETKTRQNPTETPNQPKTKKQTPKINRTENQKSQNVSFRFLFDMVPVSYFLSVSLGFFCLWVSCSTQEGPEDTA